MAITGYLGIDAGTQGLSVIFADESLAVVSAAEREYAMVPGLVEGSYEQRPEDWERALATSMKQLHSELQQNHGDDMEVLAVGISGQMHGEVLTDASGKPLAPARLWCDSRNEAESDALTEELGIKMPKRMTASRWLWTIRNRRSLASRARCMSTPAGWISHRLTGQWTLGIGDASGMFPIDPATGNFDDQRLAQFDAFVQREGTGVEAALKTLLPEVRRAGEDGGTLNERGAQLLGIPVGTPIAPAEGDQPAALAGSLIAQPGMVSMSFGTSVCANAVGDRTFAGVSAAVDHFCAVDGKPINMVFLRNGTTFMNTTIEMLCSTAQLDRAGSFKNVIPQLLDAPADCGGVLALPFMDDEPGLGVMRGGSAMFAGVNANNATPGNFAKAALLATIFNLRTGSEVLDTQGYPRNEIVLSGGLTKTPQLGQIIADVFRAPVRLLTSAEEGTAWGAALLAKYRHERVAGTKCDWTSFLEQQPQANGQRFESNEATSKAYDEVYARYRALLCQEESLRTALG